MLDAAGRPGVGASPVARRARPERSDVPVEGVLQQPGPDADAALLATPDALLVGPARRR